MSKFGYLEEWDWEEKKVEECVNVIGIRMRNKNKKNRKNKL